tara:strand:+ start:5787 stop:8105 length:2319 start_codon:yes stop_codon:yes gene_type:complete
MFYSKAETLTFLKKRVKLCKIPKSYFFSALSWKKNKKIILQEIQKKFRGNIVIRSSASDEDGKISSNAGKYISFLNIDSMNTSDVKNKINLVVKSYKKISLRKSQILIQKMVNSINCSGVVFNRDLNTAANYYVINYDDISGKSDTVTSGNSLNSNRVLFVLKKRLKDVKSTRFFRLLRAISEIEEIYKDIPLDIEFIITKKLEIYILQVRPLILAKKISKKLDNKIYFKVDNLKKKLESKFKNWKTVYGQMPDWNPAEIIGQNPYPLLASLYKTMVLDTSWIKARSIMGYSDNFQRKDLMKIFLGQSFIDVRKSFISFIPKDIPLFTQKKLVNFYVSKLKSDPSLHDKIEFEIAINCFIFDFEDRINQLCPNLLKKKEIRNLKNKYFDIFKETQENKNNGSINFNLNKIKKLNENYEYYKKEKNIKKIIKFTINNGIIPFSILARHAFVAENLLRSLIRLKIIDDKDVEKFKSDLETVTSRFIFDCNLLSNNSMNFSKFKKIYGHLRPGTYDINSKNYSSFKKDFFIKKKPNIEKKKSFILNKSKITKIKNILKKNRLNLDVIQFFHYLRESIESREYSKFIFTKYVDLVLKRISEVAKLKGLSKKQISFFNIKELTNPKFIKSSQKKLLSTIKKKEFDYKINLYIKLPLVLIDAKGVDVIPFQVSSPNFIGNKKIFSKIIFIDNNINFKKNELDSKIILIENADPGFDWLFNFPIKGLITKFGGANSHMSIRCNELKIPAAIGVGEKIFHDIKKNEQLILNCALKKIEVN